MVYITLTVDVLDKHMGPNDGGKSTPKPYSRKSASAKRWIPVASARECGVELKINRQVTTLAGTEN